MNIEIRFANRNDASIIALLGRITFSETFGHLFTDPTDLSEYYERTFSVEKIERSFDNPNNIFWLAFVNRVPVGYAKLKLNSKSTFIESKNVCQLQKIYVLKDFLSLKIGSELQKQMIEEARKSGYGTLWLSVLESNERALFFYRKSGYKSLGNHDFRIGKELFEFIAMSKTISA